MISVKVYNRKLVPTAKWPITSGSVGLPVVFQFGEMWEGLAIVAVFRGSGVTVDVPLLGARSCVVPAEVLAEDGDHLFIGVCGKNGNGDIVIPTIWGNVGYIEPGAIPSEITPVEPEPDWTAQVIAAADAALAKATAVEEAAENGEFDGVSPVIAVTDIPGGHRVTITDATGTRSFDVMDGEGGGGGSTPGQDGYSPVVTITEITGGHRVTITSKAHPEGQTFDVLDGDDGKDGSDGSPGPAGTDGVSPKISITNITGGHRVTITDADGTQTFDVMDGEDGQPGTPGTPGVSPDVTVTTITGGHRVTITDAEGTQTFDVMDGEDGQQGPAGDAAVTVASLTLSAAGWTGSGPYTHAASITGLTPTAKTKIDLQPDATALAQMISDGVQALFVTNNAGTLTATAVGAAPSADLTVQCTYFETA